MNDHPNFWSVCDRASSRSSRVENVADAIAYLELLCTLIFS
ncbi:hypothetical protein [Nostoc sp.]